MAIVIIGDIAVKADTNPIMISLLLSWVILTTAVSFSEIHGLKLLSRLFTDAYKVTIEVLEGGTIPTLATEGSNGYDCYLNIGRLSNCTPDDKAKYNRGVNVIQLSDGTKAVIIKPGGKLFIPLGFKIKQHSHLSASITPKSGIALRTDLIINNSPGLVDTDYRGEVCVVLTNNGTSSVQLNDNRPVCQMTFIQRPVIKLILGLVDADTDRGENGHGHSPSAINAAIKEGL